MVPTNNPATLLVVEDMEEIRTGMKKSLSGYGYQVLEATNADEAIEVASRSPPDLIFTEEKLPTLGDLTTRIRQLPDLHHVPIVIVNPDKEDAHDGDIIVLADYDRLPALLVRTREK